MPADDTKSRSGEAVPSPETNAPLSDEEMRALELQSEAEHEQGQRMTDVTRQAEELTSRPDSSMQ